MRITISKTDKFTCPGRYDSTGSGLSIEFELDERLTTEQRLEKLKEFKLEFEKLYWPLANYDFQNFLSRLQSGNDAFLHWQIEQNS